MSSSTTSLHLGSRDGAVVRALASHRCGLDWIPGRGVTCGLSLLLVIVLAPRVFLWVLQFSSLYKNQQVDEEQQSNSGWRATSWKCHCNSIIIIIIIVIVIVVRHRHRHRLSLLSLSLSLSLPLSLSLSLLLLLLSSLHVNIEISCFRKSDIWWCLSFPINIFLIMHHCHLAKVKITKYVAMTFALLCHVCSRFAQFLSSFIFFVRPRQTG